MNIHIDEIGENIRLKNMRISQVKQMTTWGKHEDELFADYNFPNYDNSQILEWYKSKTRGRRILIAIMDLYGEVLGYISMRKIKRFFKTAEIGIVLNPDEIDKGYGTQALRTFDKWFFGKLKYKKLYLIVAKYNARAYRVYTKIGFSPIKLVEETFDNEMVNPLVDPKYSDIRKYFRMQNGQMYVSCVSMQLTRDKHKRMMA